MLNFRLSFIVFLFLILSCEQHNIENTINEDNIENKIDEAYELTEKDDFETLIPVLFYINEYDVTFEDECLQAKVTYLKAVKAYAVYDFQTQEKFSEEALVKAIKCENYKLVSQIYNLFSIAYFRNNEPEKAKEALEKAISFGEKEENYAFLIDVYYNLIQYYVNKEDWNEVRRYAQKGIDAIKKFDQKERRLKLFTIYCARSHIGQGDFVEAEKDLKEALYLVEKIDSEEEFEITRSYRDIYITYSQYHQKKGEFQEANNYLQLADSLSILRNRLLNIQIQNLLSNEVSFNKNLLEINQKIVSNQRVLILCGIIFILVILFCLYKISKTLKIN